MKLITVVNAHNVIDGLSDREDIGAHLAYWMTKFVVKTQADADFFKNELNKLFEKYGTKTEDGEIKIGAENMEAFSREADKLQNTEAEDPGIRFSLKELSEASNFSMRQMYPLLDFITED